VTFLSEIKRRNVLRVGISYIVTAWLTIQVADIILPALQAPDWTIGFVTILFLLGLPITLVVTWMVELTPEGIKVDAGEPRERKARPSRRKSNYALFALLALAAAYLVVDQYVIEGGIKSALTAANPVPQRVFSPTERSTQVFRLTLDVVAERYLSGGLSMEESNHARKRPSRPSLVLSPDGRSLVYVATDGETPNLFLRPLDRGQATQIAGTEGASGPFFSPNSRSVGFFVDSELKRLTVETGEIRTVATRGPEFDPSFGRWTENETILLSGTEGIFEVPAEGGELRQITQVARDANEYAHGYPQLLPGQQSLLFNVRHTDDLNPSDWAINIAPLDDPAARVHIENGSDPRYLPTGHIVFARRGKLLAVPFDINRLEVTGAPFVVLENIMHGEGADNGILNLGAAQYSTADTGTLAYVQGGVYEPTINELLLVTKLGDVTRLPISPSTYKFPRFSPNGDRIAYITHADNRLHVYDLDLDIPIRLTNEGRFDWPAWSPDGSQLAISRRDAAGGIYVIAADGSGEPRRISSANGMVASWSADNILAIKYSPVPDSPWGIWTLPIDGNGEPEPFLEIPANYPSFSPDGKWIAYSSDETGRFEVYVRPFPEGAPVYRISADGGSSPLWSPDGKQLMFTDRYSEGERDTRPIMVADVATTPEFRQSRPRKLLDLPHFGSIPIRSYDISPEGDRFVIGTSIFDLEPQEVTQINIVTNWFEELAEVSRSVD
jgi:Tol biopolymer transport system component